MMKIPLPEDINPRILVFIFLFFAICAVMFGGQFLFPHRNIAINNTSNVTVIYKTIEKIVTVTPTPDGHTYFASEYQNGTRLLQRPFSWIRYNAIIAQNANSSAPKYDDNGIFIPSENPPNKPDTQDMKVTTIVYDYKIFEKLHTFNPADYKYDEFLPSDGYKFLLVFIYVFMDDSIGDDTRMWMFNRNFFLVYDGIDTYWCRKYPFEQRFKELEETFTFNNDYRVQSFKSFRQYDFTMSEENRISAGEYNDEIYYLRGGKSNAVDGFLIYEIPIDDKPEDLLVLAQFNSFGSAQWRLRT